MPKTTPHTSIPLSPVRPGPSLSLAPPDRFDDDTEGSDIVHLSKETSRQTSPSGEHTAQLDRFKGRADRLEDEDKRSSDFGSWDDAAAEEGEDDMPSDLRPSHHQPLLPSDKARQSYEGPRPSASRRSSRFRERDPDDAARAATRKRYLYAGCFLLLSLVSFAVQTETAVYIQHNLHWNKAYCML